MGKKWLSKLSVGMLGIIAWTLLQSFLMYPSSRSQNWPNQIVLAQMRAETKTPPSFAAAPKKSNTTSTPLARELKAMTPMGWKIVDEIKQFTPDSLYQQIDGRAELYKDYNMVTATFAIFANLSNETQFIELAVYDMDNPTNAFGIFSVERDPAQPSLGLGRGSYGSNGSYYIWRGRYYVQIIGSETTEALRSTARDLAHNLMELLTDSGEPVWGLAVLPSKDRVPNSEKYFRVNAMGMRFLANTYVAQYRKNNRRVTFFLSEQDNTELARATLTEYIKFAEEFGEGAENLTVSGLDLMVFDMLGAYDVVLQEGRRIGGVSSVEDRKLAIQVGIDLWKQISD